MKRILLATVILAANLATPALAADVGVSISVGQPGFYGQIDIGDFPHPPVIYAQPIIIVLGPIHRPPIYLRVAPGHAKHWSKHCHTYNACGERVYFVQDRWYEREYVPHYRKQHRDRQDGRRNERGDDNRGKEKKDRKGDGESHGRNR
jgi:hypothetical protein